MLDCNACTIRLKLLQCSITKFVNGKVDCSLMLGNRSDIFMSLVVLSPAVNSKLSLT